VVLSDKELIDELESGAVVIDPPLSKTRIQGASIDLTLHSVFQRSRLINEPGVTTTLDLAALEGALYKYLDPFEADEVVLNPGELLLGETAEAISIPTHLCGWIEGKSGRARAGLIVHCTAPHIAPGWGFVSPPPTSTIIPSGSESPPEVTAKPKRITLEMVNLGSASLKLRPGLGIAQLLLMRLGSPAAEYYAGIHMAHGSGPTHS
jgi:deoxycytidine triphosphate deaminase